MDTLTDKIVKEIETGYSPKISGRVAEIANRVPGWSKHYHYLFFQSVFRAAPELKDVLIVGVYLGRDICFMLDTAKQTLNVVGVDKFNAEPCDDWPDEKRGMSWQQAFNCEPPDIDKARANIGFDEPHAVRLVKMDDAMWLPACGDKFDFIYLDTAHDKETVLRQLKQVKPLCKPTTIIAGDDYENLEKTWGVKDAVTEAFKSHQVLAGTIWFAGAEDLK